MVKKEDEKKKKEDEKKKKEEKNTSKTDEKLDKVISGVNTLAGSIEKLIELQTTKAPEEKKEQKEEKYNPKLEDETYPEEYTPPKFRSIVDNTLSDEFGLKIVDFPDRTDFQINIVVPSKYSSLSKEDKEKGVEDIRSRIVPRSVGENGLLEWCKLIRTNLNKFYAQEGIKSPFSLE